MRGAGRPVEEDEVGRERVAKEGRGERGAWRGAARADVGEKEGAGEVRVEGVTSVERKAVRRAEEWTTTGISSRMFVGTTLCSIRLK